MWRQEMLPSILHGCHFFFKIFVPDIFYKTLHYFHLAPDVYITYSSEYTSTSNFALQAMTQPAEPAYFTFYLDHLRIVGVCWGSSNSILTF
jgi:hypothetical protein